MKKNVVREIKGKSMANQKLKILYVMELLKRKTDEQHPMTATDLIEELDKWGIEAERKSIYRDIQVLQEYGMDIEKSVDNNGFYLASRDFELPELKLLVDAVAASKFITEKKSRELVRKIEGLGSRYQAKDLQRQVVVSDRVKNANESIYYAIDEIYNCIENQHKMMFQYAEWNVKKTQDLRHGGRWYLVSPEFLLWDNEYYYLVAYDEGSAQTRHYRVDKIRNAREMEEKKSREAGQIKRGDYARKRFSMFAGTANVVTLRAPSYMAGVMLDRFGSEISLREDEDEILVRVSVEVSEPFFGWVTGLGGKVTIESPVEVRTQYRDFIREIAVKYP